MKKKFLIGLMTAVVIGAFGSTAALAHDAGANVNAGVNGSINGNAEGHESDHKLEVAKHKADAAKHREEAKQKRAMRKHMTDGIVDHVDAAAGVVYLMHRNITMAPKSVVIVVDADGTHVGSLADLVKGDHISALVTKVAQPVVQPAPGSTGSSDSEQHQMYVLTGYLIVKMEKPAPEVAPPAPVVTPAVTPAQ